MTVFPCPLRRPVAPLLRSRLQHAGLLLALFFAALCGASFEPRPARAQNPLPVIGLDIRPATVSEAGGERAGVGTAYRYFADNSRPLTIRIVNSLPGSLRVPASVVIPAGADRIEFFVGAIDNTDLDGTRTALLTASASNFFDTYFAVSILDDEAAFELAIAPATVSEAGGNARVTVRRTQNTASVAETVAISVAVANALRFPATVSFAAGQREAFFEIEAIDNNAFDGTRTIVITATRGRSGQVANGEVVIIDNELDLTITVPAPFSEGAPGPLFATVSRTVAAAEQGPLLVGVTSNDPSEVVGNTGVLMPEGATTARVPLQAVDDGEVDGPQVVTLSAFGNGYNSDAEDVTVNDNDTPDLRFSLNTASASESEEPLSVQGTLSRNTPIARAVTVALRSSSPRVVVPPTVVIPAGAVEVRFPVRLVDNSARDNTANVVLTATAAGFPTRTSGLSVLDNDGPSLELDITPREVAEGLLDSETPAATGTVRRLNAPLSLPVTVLLSSSDAKVLLLAPPTGKVAGAATLSATIAAGQSSATFKILTADNAVPTDLITATVTASASGLNSAAQAIDVRDNNDPAQLRVSVTAALPSRTGSRGSIGAPFFGPAVDENGGPRAIAVTVSRNTATTSDVIVQITVAGDISAPSVVVIPFGRSSVTFFATPIDDDRRCNNDSDVVSTITPRVAGFETVIDTITLPRQPQDAPDFVRSYLSNSVIVVDNDPTDGCIRIRRVKAIIEPRVKRTPEALAEIDGINGGTIIVKRADGVEPGDPEFSLGLVVDLVSSDPSRARAIPGMATDVVPFNAPKTPVSPARIILLPGTVRGGATEIDPEDNIEYLLPFARVPLALFNDRKQQRCTDITITPVAIGYVNLNDLNTIIPNSRVGQGYPTEGIGDTIRLLDAEPEISRLSVAPTVVNESGASGVATGVVRRAPGVTGDLVVKVRSLNKSKLFVAPLGRITEGVEELDVTIPDGQNEASFNIIAVDNTVADGNISALLEARTNCSTFTLRTPILVRDNEVPTLTLIIGPPAMDERIGSTGITALVRRNTGDLRAPLTVQLRSLDTTEFQVPATVTIPAGKASVAFTPRVINDTLDDGKQTVVVNATALGFRPGQTVITILDDEGPLKN